MAKHDWIKSTLGHGETMCSRCCMTNREAAVLGKSESCDVPLAEADTKLLAAAREMYEAEGVEINDDAEFRRDVSGTWVSAWLWLDNSELNR